MFTYGDLYDIYPFDKELCLVEILGKDLLLGLENGVSQAPAFEGRFPQVSNIFFEYSLELPSGSRINPATVKVAGAPLDLTKIYKLAITNFLSEGKDGYEPFKGRHHLIDENSRKKMRDLLLEFLGLHI